MMTARSQACGYSQPPARRRRARIPHDRHLDRHEQARWPYGAVTLRSDARVPIHFGVSYNNFVPKRIGLVMHPAAGAVVLLLLAFASHGNSANSTSSKALPYFLPVIIMCVLLAVQVGAIRMARRRSVV
jgi:hypothetical protein